MNFRVGQKVVCVDDGPSKSGIIPAIRKGAIYTIAGFTNEEDVWGDTGLFLEEVRAKFEHLGMGFRLDRFRPAVERKTDISVFTALLTPKKSKERV